LTYARIPEERRPGFLTQTVQADVARTSRPFVAALSAATFVRAGFLTQVGDMRTFHGPDADVLLDDAFTRGYCFRIADADRARPMQVGLAFEPAERRRGRVDIEGTVWIDSAARVLTELEFRYVGVEPAEARFRPGGSVAFRAMPNGVTFVDRWALRVVSQRVDDDRSGPVDMSQRPSQLPPLEVHEFGGEVAHARWGDDVEWSARLGTVRGRLMSAGLPVPNAVLHLVGTHYRAETDSLGQFEIGDLVPGRYTFAIPDSALNALDFEMTAGQSFLAERGVSSNVDMVLPTESEFIKGKCERGRPDLMSIVVGRVSMISGEPARGAALHVRQRPTSSSGGWEKAWEGYTGNGNVFQRAYDGVRGPAGAFVACGVLKSAQFEIEASHRGEVAVTRFSSREGSRIRVVEIQLGPPPRD
jgi:hypothetical protein